MTFKRVYLQGSSAYDVETDEFVCHVTPFTTFKYQDELGGFEIDMLVE